jgi:hypothetical protein
MSTIALDHLRQHVRMEVQKHLDSKSHRRPWVAMAYRGRPGWNGSQQFEEKGYRFRVEAATSLLELRSHLVGIDPQGQDRLVIVADLEQAQFPADIRSRLLHADLREIDPWRVLMAEFRAIKVDSRIKADQDLALALLQNRPAQGFRAVTTGVLDLTTLWDCVGTQVLGLPSGTPTAQDLLAWSVDDDSTTRLRAAAPAIRTSAEAWIGERDPLAQVLLGILGTVPPGDLIPLGIVLGVVHHEEAVNHPDLLRAQGRLEQITGGVPVSLRDAREWSREALVVLGKQERSVSQRLRKRSDALLVQVGAESFAALSEVVPHGYHLRLTAFADSLKRHLGGKVEDADLLAAAAAVRTHWDGQVDSHRQVKVDMATRAARWLRTPEEAPTSMPDAMRQYRDGLAFVDWARHGVVGGDPVAALQAAYAQVHDLALRRREAFNRRFAELVAAWSRTPDRHPEILRIEDLQRRVVADVAADHKVLVLVMDGMSWPVAQELMTHLEGQYWTPRIRSVEGIELPAPVLTTIPSVTEFGRTSLLCGQLARGDAGDERRGFAECHELRAVSTTSNPPVLFHRKDLEEAGRQGLGQAVADALGNQKQRIVGVVVNAVDDHLMKDDGGRRSWDMESIRVLRDLLASAKAMKRAIILCSDHGHVLDHWVTGAAGSEDGGERWHSKPARDGEIAISGPRSAPYGPSITAPWTEKVRYGGKKNGYHGGVSPQELIAPCLVLADQNDEIEGWTETHLVAPAWWSLDAETAPVVSVVASKPVKPKRSDAPGQQSLFGQVPPTVVSTAWPHRLLASPIYQQATVLAGRRRPDDPLVLKLLLALDAAPGNQLSERLLAEALGIHPVRMTGVIAQVARMLNVESYRILSYTDDRGHIRLDRTLAMTQFELEQG